MFILKASNTFTTNFYTKILKSNRWQRPLDAFWKVFDFWRHSHIVVCTARKPKSNCYAPESRLTTQASTTNCASGFEANQKLTTPPSRQAANGTWTKQGITQRLQTTTNQASNRWSSLRCSNRFAELKAWLTVLEDR